MAAAPSSTMNYPHAMIREIHEQPAALAETLAHYVAGGWFRADTCNPIREWVADAREIVIAASGSSRHAGMVAEILIEDLSGIAVDVEYASEYSYRSERAIKNASVMVISQSGETSDTLAALRRANDAGHRTLAITNAAASSMAREANVSFPTSAGKEVAVPATKSFTTQLLNVYLLSLLAAESRGTLNSGVIAGRLAKLDQIPALIERQLAGWNQGILSIAEHYRTTRSMLFLGRSVHYPIAREGALKLKESAYLHAEGYPSGELKHGPNALVGDDTPLVMLATFDPGDPASVERHEKVVQLLKDMRRQGANVFAIANHGDRVVAELATHVACVAPAEEELLPFCEVIPLQIFSYVMAVNNGIDVDRPRNLSKAVLVD